MKISKKQVNIKYTRHTTSYQTHKHLTKKKQDINYPWYADEYKLDLIRIQDILNRSISQLKIYTSSPLKDYPRYNKPFYKLKLREKTNTDMINAYYIIRSPWNDNIEINSLTDYFTERCRMQCRFGKSLSPLDYWHQNNKKIIGELQARNENISNYNVREWMYTKNKQIFCNNFRISVCLEVLDIFKPAKWLDISAGWGDRLISAILSPWVREYCGVDPNPCLHPGYKSIIQQLDPNSAKRCTLIQDGFETAKLPTSKFDLVFSSPPFFDLEIYSNASPDSLVQYNTVDKWFNGFLMPSIKKAIRHLNKGGYLVLYMGESHGTEKYISRMITQTDKIAHNAGRFYYTDGIGTNAKLREFYCWQL